MLQHKTAIIPSKLRDKNHLIKYLSRLFRMSRVVWRRIPHNTASFSSICHLCTKAATSGNKVADQAWSRWHDGTRYHSQRWHWLSSDWVTPPFYKELEAHRPWCQPTWPLAKVSGVAHILSQYPTGSTLSLFSLIWAAVSEIRAYFQNCHLWAWNLVIGQSCRSCTYTLSVRQGSKLIWFSLYGQQFLRYGPSFTIGQSARKCTYKS